MEHAPRRRCWSLWRGSSRIGWPHQNCKIINILIVGERDTWRWLNQCTWAKLPNVYTLTKKHIHIRCTPSGLATLRAGETQNRDLGFSSPAMMHGTTPACPLSPGALFLLALMTDKCDWEFQIKAPSGSKFGGLGHYGSCWVQVIEKHCVIFIALCQASVSLFHWPCYRHDEELCTEYTDGEWMLKVLCLVYYI